jgi:putative ABC transport system ATP-binding protein
MLLEATGLSAALEGDAGELLVLDDVSLSVARGEVVDIVGPSGSGKSTLLRALAGLLPGASGHLALEGMPADSMSPQEWRCAVTLLPQKPALVTGSVRDNLVMPWRLKVRSGITPPAEKTLREALDLLGLGAVALEREAVRLSVGQQARLCLARVWLTSPSVLLLDEADAALDDASAATVSEMVRRFAADGGPSSEAPAAVVRVRHRADDRIAVRRLHMEHGHLTEVVR